MLEKNQWYVCFIKLIFCQKYLWIFFFSDAVWEINDKHSWKAVNVCIRHVFSSRVDKRSSDSSAAYLLCYLECFLNLIPPRINNNGINNNTNLMVTLQRIYEIPYMKCKIVPWTYHILQKLINYFYFYLLHFENPIH